jgi:hypothetical protein
MNLEGPSVGHCWSYHYVFEFSGVSACVLNQSRRHWLLFDTLVTTINSILALEFQQNLYVDGSETCDQFVVEFHILSKNMWQEVVKVIKPFLQFLRVFDYC